jgi:hypothetical protein
MSRPRPVAAIQADIAAAALRLAELESERSLSRAARRNGIVADFDSGMARRDIAAKWQVGYGCVSAVLHQAGRTERTRCARGLTPEQRAQYDKLLRLRVASVLARSIACAIAPREAP